MAQRMERNSKEQRLAWTFVMIRSGGLAERIDHDRGRLDVLVNDIFDGGRYAQFGTTLWQHDLADGLRMLRIGIDTHAITSHFALPLLIRHPGGLVVEMTDGTAEYNAAYRHHEGFYYDLVKAAVHRITIAQAFELRPRPGIGGRGHARVDAV